MPRKKRKSISKKSRKSRIALNQIINSSDKINNLSLHNLLKSIYYDIKHVASFSTARKLWRAARGHDHTVSLDQVKMWLASQPAYTLHRKVVHKFPRRKVLVKGPNYQWQADLVDLTAIAKENSGIKYLLTVIDCFSRFAYVIPLKNKSAQTCADNFKKLLENLAPTKPTLLQTDQGKEFVGKAFKSVLSKYKIKLFHTHQDVKAQLVERFNRTLKTKMFKYFSATEELRYIDILPDLVKTYNNTPHSSLGGYAPAHVTKKNRHIIFKILYGDYLKKKAKRFKYNINDIVRLSLYRKTFKRGYEKNFTDELFKVVNRINSIPPTYMVQDQEGVVLDGAVYEPEMVLVKRAETSSKAI